MRNGIETKKCLCTPQRGDQHIRVAASSPQQDSRHINLRGRAPSGTDALNVARDDLGSLTSKDTVAPMILSDVSLTALSEVPAPSLDGQSVAWHGPLAARRQESSPLSNGWNTPVCGLGPPRSARQMRHTQTRARRLVAPARSGILNTFMVSEGGDVDAV